MSDPTNDIDALLRLWSVSSSGDHRRYHAALTALVAERNALIADRTALIAECDGLRSDRKSIWQINREQITELAAMREQRDEARRVWCYMESCRRCESAIEPSDERSIATERGWDCFKEGGARE